MGRPIFARLYAWASPLAERRGMAAERRRLVHGLRGRVLEIGAGNGLMFTHYPFGVDEVVAVEPEPHLRGRAVQAGRAARVDVTVVPGLAEALPIAAASMDAVVCCLVLCSVEDPSAALREIRRVLRPGGEVRFLEHIAPARGLGRSVACRLDRWGVYPRMAGGCHLCRDTASTMRAAGLRIERLEHGRPGGEPLPVPFIRGVARQPTDPRH